MVDRKQRPSYRVYCGAWPCFSPFASSFREAYAIMMGIQARCRCCAGPFTLDKL